MPDPFEIIVGTYEQYLLGYKVRNVVNEYKMEKSFATRSHSASVRCAANGKHYLASGGADDSVYLYDMRYRVESGRLMHHNDTVNSIAFTPDASHVFTCSNDGSIAAIRCGNWQMEKHWLKAHKGSAVNALAIHPTGKLALSTGADGILRTWNLVKGRQVYATNLVPRLRLDAKNVAVLKWSPNGEKYLLAVNQRIDIYSVDMAGINNEINFDSKIICVEFLKDDLIAVGLENGQIKLYDLEKSVQTIEKLAHDIRVKCIAYKDDLLVTASSSGEIKLWKHSKHKLDMLHSVNCGARITCLTLALPCKSLVKEKEIKLEDESKVKEKKKKFRLRQEVVIEDEEDAEEDKDKREDDDEDHVTGNWEVTSIETNVPPASKTKSNKKRSSEQTEQVNMPKLKKHKTVSTNPLKKKRTEAPVSDHSVIGETENRPKKKKKKSISAEDSNNNISREKTEDKDSSSKAEKEIPAKKTKIVNNGNTEVNKSRSKKMKNKLPPVDTTESIHPKKKKKISIEENSTNLRKKKKKQSRDPCN